MWSREVLLDLTYRDGILEDLAAVDGFPDAYPIRRAFIVLRCFPSPAWHPCPRLILPDIHQLFLKLSGTPPRKPAPCASSEAKTPARIDLTRLSIELWYPSELLRHVTATIDPPVQGDHHRSRPLREPPRQRPSPCLHPGDRL